MRYGLALASLGAVLVLGGCGSGTTNSTGSHDTNRRQSSTGRPSGKTCIDVTSYDYDWSNDMLCTRPDGTTFYTDYAGAAAFLGH